MGPGAEGRNHKGLCLGVFGTEILEQRAMTTSRALWMGLGSGLVLCCVGWLEHPNIPVGARLPAAGVACLQEKAVPKYGMLGTGTELRPR